MCGGHYCALGLPLHHPGKPLSHNALILGNCRKIIELLKDAKHNNPVKIASSVKNAVYNLLSSTCLCADCARHISMENRKNKALHLSHMLFWSVYTSLFWDFIKHAPF